MNKTKRLQKAKTLLKQALYEASAAMPNNQNVQEVRGHINKAIKKLEKAEGTQSLRQTLPVQHNTWWDNVQAGVGMAPMAAEAQMKSLEHLNALIAKEQTKIASLDQQPIQNDQILHD